MSIPSALAGRVIPDEAFQFIRDDSGLDDIPLSEIKFNSHWTVCNFPPTNSSDMDFFAVNMPNTFPHSTALCYDDMNTVMVSKEKFWMFVKLKNETLGAVYFLVENAIPDHIFSDGKFLPCFKKQDLHKENPTQVVITHVTLYMCVACGTRAAHLLRCKACNEKSHRIYYCSKECQRGHWRLHKDVCLGNSLWVPPAERLSSTGAFFVG
jgi:hypothetical protein